jgi:Tol biopolymer transport system component
MIQQWQEGTASLSFGKNPITGDFDVRVDYEILTPRSPDLNNGNQERIGLSADNIGAVERVSDGNYGSLSPPGDGEVYLTDFQPMGGGINPSPGIITTDLAGKLRLTRVGSRISGYYWNGTGWTLLYTEENGYAGPTTFSLKIWNGYLDQSGMKIAFDNFYLSARDWVGPPPLDLTDVIVVLQVLTGMNPAGINRPAFDCYGNPTMPVALTILQTLAGIRSTPQPSGVLERISVDSSGNQGNDASPPTSGFSKNSSIALSDDGRLVAFVSSASNLVAGDTNGKADVFVRDRQTGQTTRVSVASDGTQANGDSYSPSISADGRFVVFSSTATNLDPKDQTNAVDVFLHDRNTGQTRLVNLDNNGFQLAITIVGRPAISADGRYVAYSNAGFSINLHDTTGGGYVAFGYPLMGGSTIYGSEHPVLSGDGSLIAFTSDWDLKLPGDNDTNKALDVFLYNRITGNTLRISNASANSSYSYSNNGIYPYVSISRDGHFITYASRDPEVVNDTNDKFDVFVREIQGLFRDLPGPLTRVSVNSSGVEADGDSLSPSINSTGKTLTFYSTATNLVGDDTNNFMDIFVHDLATGQTRRVSVAGSVQGDGHSFLPFISPDGTVAAFPSQANNLVAGDTNNVQDIFVAATGSGISLIPPIQYLPPVLPGGP